MVDESNHDIKFVTRCLGKDTTQIFDEDIKDQDEFERGVSSTTAAGSNLSLRYLMGGKFALGETTCGVVQCGVTSRI